MAWRHLFSKKKHSLVNIISIVSAIGVLSGTAALVIVLSVFNGLEDLVVNSFNSFNPDLKVTLCEGKSFEWENFPTKAISQIDGVSSVEEVVSDLTLVEYNGKQHLIELKGVGTNYGHNSGFGNLIIDGEFCLDKDGCEYGIMGAIAAGTLQVNLNSPELFKIYYPKRLRKNLGNPLDAFNTHFLNPAGVFASYTEYDDKYLICPIAFARNLMDYEGEVTSVEIFVKDEKQLSSIQKKVKEIIGNQYLVQDKFQQEELLFKTMKTEKMMIFVILAFILLIAVFNIIGTLSMIIIEKKEDISVLNYLGADRLLIRKIFMMEGMIISFIGGMVGMFIGWLVCFLQEKLHLITFGNGTESYLVDYYPVKMEWIDFLVVFATIFIISLIVSLIPSRRVGKKIT